MFEADASTLGEVALVGVLKGVLEALAGDAAGDAAEPFRGVEDTLVCSVFDADNALP